MAAQTKRRRLQELQKRESLDDMTKDEWKEFVALEKEIREADMDAFIFPTCCEEARKHPSVFVGVNVYDGDSREAEAMWIVPPIPINDVRTHLMEKYGTDGLLRPSPKFCPYCGTPLPKLVRKDPFPEETCVVEDGGYYCSTCKERLNCCICFPSEHAWKIE
jgi:hypothetical protein